MPNTPFDDAVVPIPSGSPSGSGGVSGSLIQDNPGIDPTLWAFQEPCCPTPSQSTTPNQSGLPPQLEIIPTTGAPGRNTQLDQPSMLDTPGKNLARG